MNPKINVLAFRNVLAFSFVALLLIASCSFFDITKSLNPVSAFEITFGHKPSANITILQGTTYAFRDSGYVYLKFTCTKSELVALLGTDFTSITSTEFAEQTTSGSISDPIPAWWTPLPQATEFWQSDTFHPTFSKGVGLAAFDPTTMVAYVYWDGWD